MKNTDLVAELEALATSMKKDSERLERLLVEVRRAFGVDADPDDRKLKAEKFYKAIFDLCFETTSASSYLTRSEIFGFLKMNIQKNAAFLSLCESFGWSQKTSNSPLWRAFVAWMIDNGHVQFIHPDTGARCIRGVKKVFWEDHGFAIIDQIMSDFSEKEA